MRLSFYSGLLFVLAMPWAEIALAQDRYVDIVDYPRLGEGWGRYNALHARLVREFDDVCGDTFCEGQYSNLQSLRFRCSVERATGYLGQCVWNFAGSEERIDPVSGHIQVDARAISCRAPLLPATPVESFYTKLEEARHAIWEPLPGTSESIYDGLVGCL
ncbi:MAG TPA: hypothetical protein VIM98_13955 [Dyella sp.]|uniref:hypothetical protein n=1 Tax=Dyella sp. TaxID=1869338 RepID=UPI002F920039